jgi:hypothetical protein
MDCQELLESLSNPNDIPANVRHILFILWQPAMEKIHSLKFCFIINFPC